MLKAKLLNEVSIKNADSAFYIENLKTNETIAHQEDMVVPSASLIKLFILTKALSLVKENKMSLDDDIFVSKDAVVPYSVLEFLNPRNYSVRELLNIMIVYSDNTATNVLIESLGMDEINKHIEALGLKKSKLQRKVLDSEAAKAGRDNLTSAGEMADILKRLYTGTLLGEKYDELALEIMKGQADECMMRVNLPDEITIARKSGELDCLDHDVAIVYGNKADYIYCFFVWNAATNNDAREILANSSRVVYDYIEV